MLQVAQACCRYSPKRAVGISLSASSLPLLAGALITLGTSQPVRAQAASPLPPEMMKTTVQQVSDSLAKYVSGASCTDIAQLIKMLPTNGSNPAPDPNSIIGAVMLSIKNSPDLQSIIASRVGPPLISKAVECNMIAPELIMQVMSR
ncbi:hypothetical protein NBE99_00900 [Thermosynechococcus sp. HN-54]|uniref:hypothetical protein n=1 Tax=Thermosynechococcus sp. HN-54 TaxID=2933959 RepID=UPI00202CBB5B|nr:hypothetical protein [Thermosynechococcus sp. HN-54]URR35722.1 hypothetical protein NBE99_00900 [Thermosynechococcus sp. HN-54]